MISLANQAPDSGLLIPELKYLYTQGIPITRSRNPMSIGLLAGEVFGEEVKNDLGALHSVHW